MFRSAGGRFANASSVSALAVGGCPAGAFGTAESGPVGNPPVCAGAAPCPCRFCLPIIADTKAIMLFESLTMPLAIASAWVFQNSTPPGSSFALASAAFLRAVQADASINGVFNVACDNFTVGAIGDMVKDEVEKQSGKKVNISVKDIQDFRNYKVTCEKARTYLGFRPKYSVPDMVDSLFAHRDEYGDFSNDAYYNINTLRKLYPETAT